MVGQYAGLRAEACEERRTGGSARFSVPSATTQLATSVKANAASMRIGSRLRHAVQLKDERRSGGHARRVWVCWGAIPCLPGASSVSQRKRQRPALLAKGRNAMRGLGLRNSQLTRRWLLSGAALAVVASPALAQPPAQAQAQSSARKVRPGLTPPTKRSSSPRSCASRMCRPFRCRSRRYRARCSKRAARRASPTLPSNRRTSSCSRILRARGTRCARSSAASANRTRAPRSNPASASTSTTSTSARLPRRRSI